MSTTREAEESSAVVLESDLGRGHPTPDISRAYQRRLGYRISAIAELALERAIDRHLDPLVEPAEASTECHICSRQPGDASRPVSRRSGIASARYRLLYGRVIGIGTLNI